MRQIRPNLFSPVSVSFGLRFQKGEKVILDFGARRLSDYHGMKRADGFRFGTLFLKNPFAH